MGRGGGCIMKDVGGVLPGDFTQKFIDSVPGAAYLKFTLRANGNSVPPEQILDPDEERVGHLPEIFPVFLFFLSK